LKEYSYYTILPLIVLNTYISSILYTLSIITLKISKARMIPIYNFLFIILLISSILVSFSNSQGLPTPTDTPTDAPILGDVGPTRPAASYLVGATPDPATTPTEVPTETPTDPPTVPVLDASVDSSLMAGNNQWQSTYAIH
jgi:hypothetical protein